MQNRKQQIIAKSERGECPLLPTWDQGGTTAAKDKLIRGFFRDTGIRLGAKPVLQREGCLLQRAPGPKYTKSGFRQCTAPTT